MKIRIAGIALIGVAMLRATVVRAQSTADVQDIQIFAGYFFGDRLTNPPLAGQTPRLNDNGIYGARYTFHFSDQLGIQLSAGYSPNRAAHVVSGDTNLGVTTLDLDAEWDIFPNLVMARHQFVPYAAVGAGYAWADLDSSLSGRQGATIVTISDSNGYTANAGLGAKYYLSQSVFLDFDARYRYFSKLASPNAQGLNTAETTLSIGYRF